MLTGMTFETPATGAWPSLEPGTEWAVTINVGAGPGGSAQRTEAMTHWAEVARRDRRPAIVFAQEVTPSWVDSWTHDYVATYGVKRGWRTRSVLLTRTDLEISALTEEHQPTLGYHGDYVAAALWHNSPEGDVILASVHASPNPADLERYPWPAEAVLPRDGGGDRRYAGGRLWDSDLLLRTLELLAQDAPLVAAGDFNEARDFDLVGGQRVGIWGQEYFLRASAAGLDSLPWRRWQESERSTHEALQLDHVLHNRQAEPLLDGPAEPRLDPEWHAADHALSDHTALWFPIRT